MADINQVSRNRYVALHTGWLGVYENGVLMLGRL